MNEIKYNFNNTNVFNHNTIYMHISISNVCYLDFPTANLFYSIKYNVLK